MALGRSAALIVGTWGLWASFLLAVPEAAAAPRKPADPPPPGSLVDVGGHRLHLLCSGRGEPIVVIENGLGDFSFDWVRVQGPLSSSTRVCSYDRAGYAWSDAGPFPRTIPQLNRELRDALVAAGERGPYLLVGHSFGGPVVLTFALAYPADVAGIVLVDSVFANQRIPIRGKAVRLRDGARGRPFPAPREKMDDGDRPAREPPRRVEARASLDPLFLRLPSRERALHLWAQSLPELERAEDSQREWSAESFERMHVTLREGILGSIPVIVLAREKGGYGDGLDVPANTLEAERLAGQAGLAHLSRSGRLILVASGHAMHLEAPASVAGAIWSVVAQIRGSFR